MGLSVFEESFSAAAARCVSGADLPGSVVVELLSGLLDKSVRVRPAGPGPVRYRLLESIRQYGLERLHATGAEPAAALAGRHRDWSLALARRFRAEWFGPGQADWLRRIRSEQANFRAALDFCLSEPGEAAAGLELATCLTPYWQVRGRIHEGRYWLERAPGRNPPATPARAAALVAHCAIGLIRGDPATSMAEARRAEELARDVGEPRLAVDGRHLLGMAALLGNDLPAAREWLESAVADHTPLGDRVRAAEARGPLALGARL